MGIIKSQWKIILSPRTEKMFWVDQEMRKKSGVEYAKELWCKSKQGQTVHKTATERQISMPATRQTG